MKKKFLMTMLTISMAMVSLAVGCSKSTSDNTPTVEETTANNKIVIDLPTPKETVPFKDDSVLIEVFEDGSVYVEEYECNDDGTVKYDSDGKKIISSTKDYTSEEWEEVKKIYEQGKKVNAPMNTRDEELEATVSLPDRPMLQASRIAATKIKVYNGVTYTYIKWNKVRNVTGYAIYRKPVNGKWTIIGMINNNKTFYFKDTQVANKNGITYQYNVRPYIKSGRKYTLGPLSNSPKITRDNGVKTTAANVTSGISVKWTTKIGATGYVVYRRTTNDKKPTWTRIAVTNNKTTTFIDKLTNVKANKVYQYVVRPYTKTKKGNVYGYYSKNHMSAVINRPITPKITVGIATNGIKVTCNGQEGYNYLLNKAVKYTKTNKIVVFRKDYSKSKTPSWEAIHTIVPNYKDLFYTYTDTSAKPGVKYEYVLKAYSAYKSAGALSKAKTMYRYIAPTLAEPTSVSNGYKLTWSGGNSVTGYYVYKKELGTDNNWVRFATVSGNVKTVTYKTANKKKKVDFAIIGYKTVNKINYNTAISNQVSNTYPPVITSEMTFEEELTTLMAYYNDLNNTSFYYKKVDGLYYIVDKANKIAYLDRSIYSGNVGEPEITYENGYTECKKDKKIKRVFSTKNDPLAEGLPKEITIPGVIDGCSVIMGNYHHESDYSIIFLNNGTKLITNDDGFTYHIGKKIYDFMGREIIFSGSVGEDKTIVSSPGGPTSVIGLYKRDVLKKYYQFENPLKTENLWNTVNTVIFNKDHKHADDNYNRVLSSNGYSLGLDHTKSKIAIYIMSPSMFADIVKNDCYFCYDLEMAELHFNVSYNEYVKILDGRGRGHYMDTERKGHDPTFFPKGYASSHNVYFTDKYLDVDYGFVIRDIKYALS